MSAMWDNLNLQNVCFLSEVADGQKVRYQERLNYGHKSTLAIWLFIHHKQLYNSSKIHDIEYKNKDK